MELMTTTTKETWLTYIHGRLGQSSECGWSLMAAHHPEAT
jgi:hypothetical protein